MVKYGRSRRGWGRGQGLSFRARWRKKYENRLFRHAGAGGASFNNIDRREAGDRGRSDPAGPAGGAGAKDRFLRRKRSRSQSGPAPPTAGNGQKQKKKGRARGR